MVATIYDIAKKAGVSTATVSKVINGYPEISAGTVQRIQMICEEMGYQPNSVARGLATKKSSAIGLFFKDDINSGFRDPFLQDILASFKDVVGAAGYDLVLFSDNSPNNYLKSYVDRAIYRNVDGVLLLGIHRSDPHLHSFATSNIPCIAVDLDLVGSRAGFVTSDNGDGAFKAVRYLLEMGHTEIGLIHSDVMSTKQGHDRFMGFRQAMQNFHLPLHPEWLLSGEATENGGYEAGLRLLENENLPTAIFCTGDLIALGAIRAFNDMGLKVPDDFSIIGFNDLSLLKYVKPGLTTIRQDKEQIGRRAANELLKMIQDPHYFPDSSSMVKTELIIRETVKKRMDSAMKPVKINNN